MSFTHPMEGWILFSYFKIAFALLLCSCGLEYVEPQREYVEKQVNLYSPDDIQGFGKVLNQDLYPAAGFMSACSWLDSMVIGENNSQQAFRALEAFGTKKFAAQNGSPFGFVGDIFDGELYVEKRGWVKASEFSEDTTCEESKRARPRDGFRERGRNIVQFSVQKCKDKARMDAIHDRSLLFGDERDLINMNNLFGRIQLNDYPMMEYGLLGQSGSLESQGQIPNRQEFMNLFDEEIYKSPIRLLPMMGLKLLLKTGIVSWAGIRNDKFTKKVGESIPGVYDEKFELYGLQGTYADAFIKNGFPYSEILKPLPTDTEQEIERKDAEMRKVLGQVSKRVPMFRNSSWDSFLEDMRYGMSVAIRGMKSTSPMEQACASTIYQRAFSQLLTIKGYDRPPLKNVVNGSKRRKALVEVEDFLDSKEGTRMKACRRSGSFLREGKLTQVKDLELAEDDIGEKLFLTNRPNSAEECSLSEARPLREQKVQPTFVESARGFKGASLQERLEFLGGVSYFLMSIIPGSSWWFSDNSPVPYPLSDFGADKTVEDVRSSGGMLPFEAFAVSIAYINMVGLPIIENHIVYIDIDGKEVASDSPDVKGIRVSRDERKPFDKNIVVSDMESVALISDIVFKLHDALEILADWHRDTQESLDMLEHSNSASAKKLKEDYQSFMTGILGSDSLRGAKETLNLLIDNSDGSLRQQMNQLRLALALHLNKFAILKDPNELSKGYTCASELHLNPKTGVEEKVGRCNVLSSKKMQSEDELWRQSMRLIGRAFQIPLFLEMAGS